MFSYHNEKKQIDIYLAQSSSLVDLENRIKKLDQQGAFNRF